MSKPKKKIRLRLFVGLFSSSFFIIGLIGYVVWRKRIVEELPLKNPIVWRIHSNEGENRSEFIKRFIISSDSKYQLGCLVVEATESNQETHLQILEEITPIIKHGENLIEFSDAVVAGWRYELSDDPLVKCAKEEIYEVHNTIIVGNFEKKFVIKLEETDVCFVKSPTKHHLIKLIHSLGKTEESTIYNAKIMHYRNLNKALIILPYINLKTDAVKVP